MDAHISRANRGPAAAAENRQAIMSAARLLLREKGYHVPLSVIAKQAGVSQGVMYRHFRDRMDLAFAVFEENFQVLEELASREDPAAILPLWECLLDYAVTDTGFVELLMDSLEHTHAYDGGERLLELLGPPLARACAARIITEDITPEHLFTAWKMAYGIAVLAGDRQAQREQIHATLSLPKLMELFS